MRILLVAFAYVFACGVCPAATEPFYVAGRDGIYSGTINPDTGKLGPLERKFEVANPLFLAQSPTQPVLYAGAGSKIVAVKVVADGSLQALGDLDIKGQNLCHLTCDAKGNILFAVDYNKQEIFTLGLNAQGAPQKLINGHCYGGTGPNKERQEAGHAHGIYVDPENMRAYMCDLGSDCVWTLHFDAETGIIDDKATRSVTVPAGSGSRHLAFSLDGANVYVNGELGANVTRFVRNRSTGALQRKETVSTLTSDRPTTDGGTGEIVLHLNGKWLYVSNRLGNTIAHFFVEPDGKLKLIEDAPSVADFVRSFWIDPSGRWIVAAGEKDNRIVVLNIDQENGLLTSTDQSVAVPEPLCVLFVPPVK